MLWMTPAFEEIDLGCEINMYANAELETAQCASKSSAPAPAEDFPSGIAPARIVSACGRIGSPDKLGCRRRSQYLPMLTPGIF